MQKTNGITRMLITSLILMLTMMASAVQAVEVSGGSEQDRADLLALSEDWTEDYISGNIDGLMAVMSDDVMILSQKSATVSGTEAVRAYFEARAGKPGVTFKDSLQEIHVNGDSAFVRGDFVLEIAPWEEGKPGFTRHGRYLVLYERNAEGKWKMIRDIDNDMPAE